MSRNDIDLLAYTFSLWDFPSVQTLIKFRNFTIFTNHRLMGIQLVAIRTPVLPGFNVFITY